VTPPAIVLPPAQAGLTGDPASVAVRAIGLVLLAAVLATVFAAVYRWHVRSQLPNGVAVLVGISGVALYPNSTKALASVIGGSTEILTIHDAVFNTVTLLLAIGAALAGRRFGDHFGESVLVLLGARRIEADVSAIVRTVGRMTVVTLPDEDGIEDMEGYDPVPPETKAKLAGETLTFPRRLTVEELEGRIEERIKSDYGVGRIDVELDETGEVTYFAVGSRQTGIGPTLPPKPSPSPFRATPPPPPARATSSRSTGRPPRVPSGSPGPRSAASTRTS